MAPGMYCGMSFQVFLVQDDDLVFIILVRGPPLYLHGAPCSIAVLWPWHLSSWCLFWFWCCYFRFSLLHTCFGSLCGHNLLVTGKQGLQEELFDVTERIALPNYYPRYDFELLAPMFWSLTDLNWCLYSSVGFGLMYWVCWGSPPLLLGFFLVASFFYVSAC